MLFNSLTFAWFFPVVYAAYLLVGHRHQNRLLLVASYVFYSTWDVRFLSLILISTVVDFTVARRIHATRRPKSRKAWLAVSVATNLGLLGTFKYFDFFAEGFVDLAHGLGFQADAITLGVALPVGISFYTFQTLGYTIDVYRRRFEPERQLLDFALFVGFFPQLVAGPIERAAKLLPQLKGRRRVTADHVASGLWLIAWGYFLKVFVADNLGPIVDTVFASDDPSAFATLTAGYAFAFQIFGDFAGYSSIAIGLAQLLGIELSTNFLFPYFATNPREFWRNWHITLSAWLRDYLYVPLGGNRGSRFRTYRNLFITMLLGGLWHGANWTFVAWGAFHGALLCIHRMLPKSRHEGGEFVTRPFARLWTAFRIIAMFQLTCLGWLVFRSASLDQAVTMYSALVGAWRVPLQSEITWALEVGFYSLPVLAVSALQRRTGDVRHFGAIPRLLRIPLLVAMFYGLVFFGNWGGSDFYYFQF